MRILHSLLIGGLGGALVGCPATDDDRPLDADAAAADAATPDAADPGPIDAGTEADGGAAGPLTVLFGDAEDAWLTADDGRAPYVWGFQGGTMVRPVIVIDHPDFVAGQDVFVQIEHTPDPAAPEAYAVEGDFERFTLELPLQETPAGLATGALDDQLGWDELAGSRLQFTATVEGLDATWSRPLELYLHEAGDHPCDPISEPSELEGSPCRVAVYRGDVVLDDVQPRDSARCEPLTLVGDGPFEPAPGDACAPRLGIEASWYTAVEIERPDFGPPLSTRCAADLGIVPGARVPGALRIDYGLGCDPRPRVTLDVNTADCRCP